MASEVAAACDQPQLTEAQLRMSGAQLGDAELRLLRVLEALLRTRSVTRAAAQLGITPSAVSHSLRDLRVRFDDPLLVRVGAGMQPTPRALALEPSLRLGLAELRRVLAVEVGFEPATSQRSFSLASPDYPLFTRLPALVGRLRREAPGLDFRLMPLRTGLAQVLASGELDVVLAGGEAEETLGLDRETMRAGIISEPFFCVMRSGHPLAAGPLDLAAYAAAEHVLISTTGGERGIADHALAQHGLERRVALTVPSFAAAVYFVAESEMIATVPEAIAVRGAQRGLVVARPPPLTLPDSTAYLYWHPRFQNDPGHAWWRTTLLQAFMVRPVDEGAAHPSRSKRLRPVTSKPNDRLSASRQVP